MSTAANERVPILMYHRLFGTMDELAGSPKAATRYWLAVEDFERQILALAEHGYHAVSLAAVLAGAETYRAGKPIVISFDDGWASDYRYARPVLDRLGWTSDHFVTVSWVGGERYVSWKDLEEMSLDGVGIHSHSLTHRDFDRLSAPEIRDELAISKAQLEERLGGAVHYLALPGGTGDGRAVNDVARELGYRAICTSRIGLNGPDADPFALRRIPVTRDTTAANLLRYVEGGADLERLALLRETLRVARTVVPRPVYESLRELVLR